MLPIFSLHTLKILLVLLTNKVHVLNHKFIPTSLFENKVSQTFKNFDQAMYME